MANTANKRPINSNIGAANLSFGVILEDYVPGTGAVFNNFLQNYWRLKWLFTLVFCFFAWFYFACSYSCFASVAARRSKMNELSHMDIYDEQARHLKLNTSFDDLHVWPLLKCLPAAPSRSLKDKT
jgi:hypothetical protein